MNGTLFKYGPGSAQLAFKTPATRPRRPAGAPSSGELVLVLVGGLTDGLLFAPYAQQLASAVGDLGWSLVQAQLTSSYQGWGLASLDRDASELRLLSQHLAAQHNSKAWVLMGHSTGCQDAVRYVQKHLSQDSRLAGVILQAPVSDREYLSEFFPSWQEQVPRAEALIQQGKPEEVVFRVMEWDGAAVTARRLVNLCCPQGDDDMFSTDLTREQLQAIVGPLHTLPLLMLVSESDEAVPEGLRQSGAVAQLMERILLAVQDGPSARHSAAAAAAAAAADGCLPPAATPATGLHGGLQSSCSSEGVGVQRPQRPLQKWVGIAGAGHACKGHEEAVVEQVCSFLQQLTVRDRQLQP